MSDMTPEQIEAALKAGIISEDQAIAMRVKSAKAEVRTPPPSADDAAVIGNEDDMRFVRSFSDVFIAIGVGLFALGLTAMATLMGGDIVFLGAALIMALMAEYFGKRKRQHLPTLITALAFLIFTQIGLASVLPDLGIGSDIVLALSVFAAMLLFYLRVRLPFCMALIAIALLYVFYALLWQIAPGLMKSQAGWMLMIGGLATLAVALWYDTHDRHRTTRFSDNAFWLHFTAAPLIVHGLVLETVTLERELLFDRLPVPMLGNDDAAIMGLIVIIIALFGLAINRRALIVSSLGYAGFAIGFLMKDTGLDIGKVVAATFLLLGGVIIFLGAGWHSARNALIKVLPSWPIFPPPYDPDYKG